MEGLNRAYAAASPQELLAWAVAQKIQFGLASSFGAEDVVLADMLARVKPNGTVLMLDTLRLHTETYGVVDATRARYPQLDLRVYYPDMAALDSFVSTQGYNAFYQSMDNRKACCGVRKVEPLARALAGLDAWVTGMRRDQGTTRTDIAHFEIDDVHGGMLKLNPLAAWSSDQVWEYIRANDVPYNPLHDVGFPSIGCAPCTRAVAPGEDPRAGRWWWELDPDAKECGIHIGYDAAGNAVVQRISKA
ncbi:MAG: phosphoadenylyl-sulfate reductase [Dehalococcoidia bacterium]|nr:phosphoadenylyl-sulfate reductase [Dehalococcoidia bacterium]